MTGQIVTKLPLGKEEVRGGYKLALIPKMRDRGFVIWASQTSVRGFKKSFQHSFDGVSRKGLVGELISKVLGSTANVCLENLLSGSPRFFSNVNSVGSPEWKVKRSPRLSSYQAESGGLSG